eukprot:CAMPEP_0117648004 /NCGR_PEP_ID=MMETSP0804-20121206/153_1 /TAXON_ID=1074897 /ORGANISM="Tetraselmis astigmatica, Strain CCMP880" /LENGTH=103 /DNA_ID=CAMNT_0005453537 /DNA_START=1070 /DNA_END=1379 /DNA_ORIENTATION=+
MGRWAGKSKQIILVPWMLSARELKLGGDREKRQCMGWEAAQQQRICKEGAAAARPSEGAARSATGQGKGSSRGQCHRWGGREGPPGKAGKRKAAAGGTGVDEW